MMLIAFFGTLSLDTGFVLGCRDLFWNVVFMGPGGGSAGTWMGDMEFQWTSALRASRIVFGHIFIWAAVKPVAVQLARTCLI